MQHRLGMCSLPEEYKVVLFSSCAHVLIFPSQHFQPAYMHTRLIFSYVGAVALILKKEIGPNLAPLAKKLNSPGASSLLFNLEPPFLIKQNSQRQKKVNGRWRILRLWRALEFRASASVLRARFSQVYFIPR